MTTKKKPDQNQRNEQPAKPGRAPSGDQLNEQIKRDQAHRERVQNVEPTQEYTPAEPPKRR